MPLYDINGNPIMEFGNFNVNKWNGKKVIVDGDSITHAGAWHTWLKSWFNWGTVYNHACSGNTLTTERKANDASGVGIGLKGYERVEQNYEDDADAIILMGDGNGIVYTDKDWGTIDDTTEDTWFGRMNLMLTAIDTKYPLKPVVLIANPPRGSRFDEGRKLHSRQANDLEALSNKYGYYFIDCLHTNLLRPDIASNSEAFTTYADGVHLNELASKLEAQMIFEELKKVGFDF